MQERKKVALIVAHPGDESLWAGGTILSHPSWECFIVCLCRGNDEEHDTRFRQALKVLRTDGIMGDLNDGQDQKPLEESMIEQAILKILPAQYYDMIISHHPTVENTRHIRQKETGRAVIRLWHSGRISSAELRVFAYEHENKAYLPRPVETADIHKTLTKRIWLRKYSIITETYGNEASSFEAKTTPRAESFHSFTNSFDARRLMNANSTKQLTFTF